MFLNYLYSVGINIALRKPAYQSSTLGSASALTDGNRNRAFKSMSCTLTNQGEEKPWWMVDLLKEFNVAAVQITNVKYSKLY